MLWLLKWVLVTGSEAEVRCLNWNHGLGARQVTEMVNVVLII